MAEINTNVARTELILGGQKSGKSRRAEALAVQWLASGGARRAVLIATGVPHDVEMRSRIERHQRDRSPGIDLIEEPLALADTIERLSAPGTLLVIDCLTLWLTNWLMPAPPLGPRDAAPAIDALCARLATAPGPVVLVGNEIGLGVIPMGAEVRGFVDALGTLNQRVAVSCERVTLMVAGLPLRIKGAA